MTKNYLGRFLNCGFRAALALVFISAGTAHAADITWGTNTAVSAASEVATDGALVEAFNLGGTTSGTDQTVNGVLFTGKSDFLNSNSNSDFYSGSTGDAAYDAVLSALDFGNGGDLVTKSVGNGNLRIGREYLIQVWYVQSNYSNRVMQLGDGNGNVVNLTSDPGQYAIGTFVADGTSQTLTLDAQEFGNAHMTAYQVRDTAGALVLVVDKFGDSAGVINTSRFTAGHIDSGRWIKRDAAWAISDGQLTNPALVANDERVAHRMDSVNVLYAGFTKITVAFDYSVGAGTTLYYFSHLFTGEPSGLLARLTQVNGSFYQDWSGAFSGPEYRLHDGNALSGSAGNALASFAGGTTGTNGTFTQTFDISGYGGGGFGIGDVSYVLNSFTSNNDTTGGAISIDNLVLSIPAPTIWDGSDDTTWTDADATSWSGGTYTNGVDALFLDAGAGTVTLSGTIAPGSVTVDSTNNYTFSGAAITGTGMLDKHGSGTLTLVSTNTYTGDTVINNGGAIFAAGNRLVLANASGAAIQGNVIIGSNSGGSAGAVLATTEDNQFGATSVVSFNTVSTGYSYFELRGTPQTIAGLSSSGSATRVAVQNQEGGTAGAATLTINNTDDYDYNGLIRDTWSGTVGALSIVKTGSGTQVLSGASTYTGDTTVSEGTLEIGGAGRLAAGNYTGSITNNGVFRYNSTADQALGGVISGTGDLEKDNTSTLTLSGDNTYTGITRISAGTLEIGGAGRLAAGNYTGSITNNAIFLYNSTADQTLGGVISGPGDLEKDNSGTLTLSGDNTYTGATVVNGGTLSLSGSLSDAAIVTIAEGAFMNLDAGVSQVVAGLTINGVARVVPGTYGRTGHPTADFKEASLTGEGVLVLVSSGGSGFFFTIR